MNPSPENNYIKTILRRLNRHAVNNPITSALAAMTGTGGFLILMFFLHINFMPDIDLPTASSLLYASAFIGAFLASTTMALLVAPGVILFLSVEKASNITPTYLLSITFGAAVLWLWILLRVFDLGPPYVSYVGGVFTTLLLPSISYFRAIRTQTVDPAGLHDPHTLKKGLNPVDKPKSAYFVAILLILTLAFAQSSLVAILAILGINGDMHTESKEGGLLILGIILVLVAIFTALIGNASKSEMPKVVAVSAPILLFLVLTWLGSFLSFPTLAIHALGQGEINSARITVTGKTCQEIQQTLGQKVCAATSYDEPVAICPVRIRSRIGSQIVLDFAPMQVQIRNKSAFATWVLADEGPNGKMRRDLSRRVILDKTKLLSWQPLQALPEVSLKADDQITSMKVAAWSNVDVAKSNAVPSHDLQTILKEHCGELR